VTAKYVMCAFALYIKCSTADMNVTEASEQWVCFCNLNCHLNKGIYTFLMSHKMLNIYLDFQPSAFQEQ
jgi:hypothetical protein